jgi:hypothetical protein
MYELVCLVLSLLEGDLELDSLEINLHLQCLEASRGCSQGVMV